MKQLVAYLSRPRTALALKSCISVSLIVWMVSYTDLGALGERAMQLRVEWLSAAVALFFLQALVATQRWVWVLRELDIEVSFGHALRMVFVGLFFNQTLPTTLGGDIFRVWELRRAQAPLGAATSSVVFDRMSALLAVLIIIASSLPALSAMVSEPLALASLLLMTLGALAAFLLGVHADVILHKALRWRLPPRLVPALRSARHVLLNSALSTKILGSSLVIALMTGIATGLLAKSLGVNVDILTCCILLPPVILLTTLPISLAGWGVREAAMVIAFGYVNVAAADALVLSITFGFVVMLIGMPGGVLWLTRGYLQAPPIPDGSLR